MALQSTLEALVATLPKRQKDIITQRFGIGGKSRTLAYLGDKYGITRERVRQIETAALKVLLKSSYEFSDLEHLLQRALDHITSLGGVRHESYLVDDMKFVLEDQQITLPFLTLFFSIFKKPLYAPETADMYAFWYVTPAALKENKQFVTKVAQFLKNKKEALIERQEFDTLFSQVTTQHHMQEFMALNFLLNSKKFSVNPFGDFGLIEWPEIMPKTVRDKSYLILKKRHAPMHFRDIAQEINNIKFDAKKAHPQTVHNELIKDNRFVLVGRGLYSLKEFGIEPGTTRELLQKILKKNGPMPLDNIVQLVGEHRVLKHNTIFLNLQNKKFFKKNPEGHYHVA